MIYQVKKKRRVRTKNKPIKFKIEGNDYNRFYNETSDEDYDDEYYNKYYESSGEYIHITDMPPLENDEEKVKEEKGLKIIPSKRLLTWLPILLVHIKLGNKSYKLKNEIQIKNKKW